MKTIFRQTVLISLVLVAGAAVGDTYWPSFMGSQFPGASSSPVKAELPPDLMVESPAAEIPADKARWSGKWTGWACRSEACDTKLLVEKITPEGASIGYAFASSSQPPFFERVKATFVDGELRGTLSGGAKIAYRMRKSGDIEFMWSSGNGKNWSAGVLSKEK